jgi:hypothetical protein
MTIIRRTFAAFAAGALLLGAGAGCAKRTIDADKTNSVEVPGTDGSLMKFCDGTILIYWTPGNSSSAEDDYEFIVYDGCTADGRIVNGAGAIDINPGTPSSGQPRTEDLQPGDEKD